MRISFNTETLQNNTIEKLDDGTYRMPVGAVNVFNSYGAYYTDDGIEETLGQASLAYKKLMGGFLYGEHGHPKRGPGQSWKDYIRRLLVINDDNICVLFTGYEIVETQTREPNSPNGKNIKLIYATFKPSGVKADTLQKSLDDESSNTAFSVRSLTTDWVDSNGILNKKYRIVVVWDFVHAPGIRFASKRSVSLESEDPLSVDMDDTETMNEIHDAIIEEMSHVSNESDMEMLKEVATLFDCKHGSVCNIYKW